MTHLVLGSLLLSLLHAAIPNHWLPLVLIGKSEGWEKSETMLVAGVAALAHTASTIGLGIIIGLIGVEISDQLHLFPTIVAPLVLIFMGLIYFGMDMGHSHHAPISEKEVAKKSKRSIVISVCVAMFFSPCLEIETFYFSAGHYGWEGILTISLVYLLVTVSGIMALVAVGGRSLEKVNFQFLENHEKKITGITLILLGIFTYFFH
ncbi:hypothetical protein [Telluribacter sp.]|uniref:hypothetical protein n=1 Tax=Telluribacter sp. TaxID=1978767 RepID=UPI002E1159B2|nr:hypothetical protein [Telluribacter sp.]